MSNELVMTPVGLVPLNRVIDYVDMGLLTINEARSSAGYLRDFNSSKLFESNYKVTVHLGLIDGKFREWLVVTRAVDFTEALRIVIREIHAEETFKISEFRGRHGNVATYSVDIDGHIGLAATVERVSNDKV